MFEPPSPPKSGFAPNNAYKFFGDLNSGSELSCFFKVLLGATGNGGCKIPLEHSNGVDYSFSPIGAIIQLQDKVQDQQIAELASAA